MGYFNIEINAKFLSYTCVLGYNIVATLLIVPSLLLMYAVPNWKNFIYLGKFCNSIVYRFYIHPESLSTGSLEVRNSVQEITRLTYESYLQNTSVIMVLFCLWLSFYGADIAHDLCLEKEEQNSCLFAFAYLCLELATAYLNCYTSLIFISLILSKSAVYEHNRTEPLVDECSLCKNSAQSIVATVQYTGSVKQSVCQSCLSSITTQ